jgi:hypothetical protein
MTDETNKLTLKQVSDKHGVSVATLRRWIAEGKIPSAEQSKIKIGAGYVWLIPEDAEIPTPIDEGARHPDYNRSPKNLRINEFA